MTDEEASVIAEDLGVEVGHVREMENRLAARDAAFDGGLDDDEDEAYQAPAQYLEDRGADPALILEDAEWQSDSHKRLTGALSGLDERSQDIIQQRWLSEDKATLHDLAAKYSVSAERIRQLEQAAMKKVRAVLDA